MNFHQKWLSRALRHPKRLAVLSLALIAVSYICYHFLGSDLLPEMDEGGFIVDYIMPAGSSLAETNRVITHVEKILREVPEVESTSRRTGMQLGLAAVTEANTGDVSVKLRDSRSRGIDEVIEEVRTKIKAEEPALDVEFIQILQDMIGDLTSAPQPVQIKLFAQDQALLADWAPKVADSIGKIKGVVDVLNGIDNTISGPAVTFQINPGVAARAGFTPEEVATDAAALVGGEPAPTPVISNDRAYTLRVRFPDRNRASIGAMRDTLLTSSTGKTATLGALADITSVPGQTEILRENLQRQVAVTARLEGTDLGTGYFRSPEGNCRSAFAGRYSSGIRRHLQRAAAVFSRPCICSSPRRGVGFLCSALRVWQLCSAARDIGFRVAVNVGRFYCLADHPNDFQHFLFHGDDHGDRHCG